MINGILIQLLLSKDAMRRSAEDMKKVHEDVLRWRRMNKEAWRRRDEAAGIIDVEAREVFDVPLLEKPE